PLDGSSPCRNSTVDRNFDWGDSCSFAKGKILPIGRDQPEFEASLVERHDYPSPVDCETTFTDLQPDTIETRAGLVSFIEDPNRRMDSVLAWFDHQALRKPLHVEDF